MFVKVDDFLASLGKLAGRQEFFEDLRLGVVDQILASDFEVNNGLDLVTTIITSLEWLGVLNDTECQVMIVGDDDDFGYSAARGCGDVGGHGAFLNCQRLGCLEGKNEEKKKKETHWCDVESGRESE
jgi:hypothetical protein